MTGPIPNIGVQFTGEADGVTAAVRALVQELQGFNRQARDTTSTADQSAAASQRMARGWQLAAIQARAVTEAAQRSVRAIIDLNGQQVRAAQEAARLTASVHPVAAAMTQSGRGTEVFAQRLRALDASGLGARRGLDAAGRSAGGSAAGFRKAENAVVDIGLRMVGLEGHSGRLAEGLLLMGIGGSVTLALTAGLALAGLAYRELTEDQRKAREETDSLIASLLREAQIRADRIDPAGAVRRALQGGADAGDDGKPSEGIEPRNQRLNREIAELRTRIERAQTSGRESEFARIPALQRDLAELERQLRETGTAAGEVGHKFAEATEKSAGAGKDQVTKHLEALAQLREAGVATAAELAEIDREVVRLTAARDSTKDPERRAELQGLILSLTKEIRVEKEKETDAQKKAREELERQARAAGELLKIDAERRKQLQRDTGEAQNRAFLEADARARGAFVDFEDLLARAPRGFDSPEIAALTAPPSLAEAEARRQAEIRADQLAATRALREETERTVDAYEQLGVSIRTAVAGGLRGLFTDIAQLGRSNPNSGAIAVREREAEEVQQQLAEANRAAAAGDEAAAARARDLTAEYDRLQDKLAELKAETTDFGDVAVAVLRRITEAIADITSELLGASLVDGLQRMLGGSGVLAAPTDLPVGLGTRGGNLTQSGFGPAAVLPALSPALNQAQETASAAQLTAAGATLSAAAGTLTASGGTLAASGGAVSAGAAAVTSAAAATAGSAGALTGSAAAHAGAAAALTGAAAALTAAAAVPNVSFGLAGGGPLRGPGTPTSDSILLRGSTDEFMQPARAVHFYGLDFMESVRSLDFPRYADGGLIGGGGIDLPTIVDGIRLPDVILPALPAAPRFDPASAGAARAGASSLEGEILIRFDRGLIVDVLRGEFMPMAQDNKNGLRALTRPTS